MDIIKNTCRVTCIFFILVGLTSCGSKKSATRKNSASAIKEIILGGDDQVMIIDYSNSAEDRKFTTWHLKTSDIVGLPDSLHKYFKTVDDAKSVDDDKKILISSSSGGVALVDRKTKKCLFYAKAPNAHSVEYLPNGRIGVALSTAKGGNSIKIYDINLPDKPLFTDSLYSGHGITWNKERNILYALGYDQLRAYSLENWNGSNPRLKLVKEWKLPATGGHDLFAPSSNRLLLSTSKAVWDFDIQTERFSPFAPIAKEEQVKSVYFNEDTEEVVFTKGEISWWTHQIHLLNPARKIKVPEMNLYKVRIIGKK